MGQIGQRDAILGSQSQAECFQVPLGVSQKLFSRGRRPPLAQPAAVILHRTHVPATLPAVKGVRRRSQAEIGLLLPIFGVVAGDMVLPPGEVGDFIMPVAPGLQMLRSQQKESPLLLFPRLTKSPRACFFPNGVFFSIVNW